MAKPEVAQSPEQEALKQRLLEISDAELIASVATHRAKITERKSEHGKTGRAVAAANEDLELILQEIERRDQRRRDEEEAARQPVLDGLTGGVR
ncbi:MAG: hypothetical protein KGL39_37185 [Patescibacteria group bacterium]|nr:hypothetical protein [Patescibacteria group bacterium]